MAEILIRLLSSSDYGLMYVIRRLCCAFTAAGHLPSLRSIKIPETCTEELAIGGIQVKRKYEYVHVI